MKCPRCSADITANNECDKCSLPVPDQKKELEVEYKDFKTSELLEIRQRMQANHSRTEPTRAGQIVEEAFRREDPAVPSLLVEKSSFPLFVFVLLILVVIIGGFFLVRHLFSE